MNSKVLLAVLAFASSINVRPNALNELVNEFNELFNKVCFQPHQPYLRR